MPFDGEQHPWMQENGIPYVWDSRFGTYIPANFSAITPEQAESIPNADPRYQNASSAPAPEGSFGWGGRNSSSLKRLSDRLSKPTQAVGTNAATATGGRTIAVLMPDQTTKTFAIDDPALDAALSSGARPSIGGGISTDMRQFQGGWLVNYGGGYIPLNVAAGGEWQPGQREALQSAGIAVGDGGAVYDTPDPAVPPVPTPPSMTPPSTAQTGSMFPDNNPGGTTYQDNGWTGDPNAAAPAAAAPALSTDLEDALRELMQEARNQGVRGQQALTGLVDDYKNYLGFTRSAAEQTFNRRNQLTDALLGKLSPAIDSAIGTMNESTGLSPEAMAALRGQAIEGTQRDYQGQVSELKTALGQRGAYGGSTPGDFNAILSGYAPLMQNRDAQRSNLLANTIFANEQRKFDTLNLNRNTAMSALGTGAGLTSALAGAYNPASMFGANEGALSGLLNTVNAGNASQMSGLNTAANIAGVWGESQPTSFKNMLLSALAGTIVSNGPKIADGLIDLGGWVWDKVSGTIKKAPTGTNDPTLG